MRVYSLTFGFNQRQLLHSQLLFMSAQSCSHSRDHTSLYYCRSKKKFVLPLDLPYEPKLRNKEILGSILRDAQQTGSLFKNNSYYLAIQPLPCRKSRSKLTIETVEWRRSGVVLANGIVLVSLLLTLNVFYTLL